MELTSTNSLSLLTSRQLTSKGLNFLRSHAICASWRKSLPKMVARMSVWNQLGKTGFRSTTYCNYPAMLCWRTPSTSKPSLNSSCFILRGPLTLSLTLAVSVKLWANEQAQDHPISYEKSRTMQVFSWSTIAFLAGQFKPKIDLVMTVPGIQLCSASAIITEIGADMFVFPTAKHICLYAGLVLQNNESAGNNKTTCITCTGAYIKPLLVQWSLTICNSDKHPEIKARYFALKKRRGHKKGIIAICRMLLSAIYAILSKGESYNPQAYLKVQILSDNRSISVE